MDAQGSSVIVYLFLGLLALSAVLIVWMLVTLVRSEVDDERRKLIVGKASTWTLIQRPLCPADGGGSDVRRLPGLVQAQVRRLRRTWRIRSGS